MLFQPRKISLILGIVVAALLVAGVARAQTTIHTMTNDPDGGLIRSIGTTDTGGDNRLIGSSTSANQGLSNVYFFELPTLGPKEAISDAKLNFNFPSKTGTPTFNTDLYGLGFVNAPVLDANWFAEGPATDNRTRAGLGTGTAGIVSLIDDDILTPTTSFGNVSTTETAALIGFLDSLYADGAQGGDFAAFHFIADQTVSNAAVSNGYRINHAPANTALLAELEITSVVTPEPASILIWSLLGSVAALFGWRKFTRTR